MRLSTHRAGKDTPLATLAISISVEYLTAKHATHPVKSLLSAHTGYFIKEHIFFMNTFVMLLLYIFANGYILRVRWVYVIGNAVSKHAEEWWGLC